MKQNSEKPKYKQLMNLVQGGLIAALYVALTLLLQPIGFGSVQCRVAEMLTILPVYTAAAIPGLTVGCFLSNLIGLSAGVNPTGAWDLLLGTAATGVAAWLSYCWRRVRLKGLPVASVWPPVILNALVVGTELYVVYGGMPLYLHMALVGLGQLVACAGGGLLLAVFLEKTGVSRMMK